MKIKGFSKLLIALASSLVIGVLAGCTSHEWESSSSMSSIESSSESESQSSESSSEAKTYKIKWVNYDDSLLYTSKNVLEGEYPVYGGETPTRPDTVKFTYTWSGWTPEVVPATKNTTYKATYEETIRTYTVTFGQNDTGAKYSQTVVENVPAETVIRVFGNFVLINDVKVIAEPDVTEEEMHYHDYKINSWSINDQFMVTSDMNIDAYVNYTDKYYDLTYKTHGVGGEIQYSEGGSTFVDLEHTYPSAKIYTGTIVGGTEGEVVTDRTITLSTEMYGVEFRYIAEARDTSDIFNEYVFEGWYYNDEPVHYGDEILGDAVIEAYFTANAYDYSYMFEYEYDDLRREASIVAIKSEYSNLNVKTLILPREVNGYLLACVKNSVMTKISGLENLYIPNTFIYFEECDYPGTFSTQIQHIYLEEGNYHMRLVDGVLFNYNMTEIIVATGEFEECHKDGRYVVPDTVTYIWKCAFRYRNLVEITLPNTLTVLTDYCFYANNLISFTIPETVETISYYAVGANKYETIDIPDSVKTLEGGSIGGACLKTVNIGSGARTISDWLFDYTYSVQEINVSANNPYFSSYNGVLYSKDFSTLLMFPTGLREAPAFAAGLKKIKYNAFRSCAITNITLPEGLEEIESSAFYDCKYLTTVYLPVSLNKLGAGIFSCAAVNELHYAGTMAQFEAIEKPTYGVWYSSCWTLHAVICTDGDIPITPTNGY